MVASTHILTRWCKTESKSLHLVQRTHGISRANRDVRLDLSLCTLSGQIGRGGIWSPLLLYRKYIKQKNLHVAFYPSIYSLYIPLYGTVRSVVKSTPVYKDDKALNLDQRTSRRSADPHQVVQFSSDHCD